MKNILEIMNTYLFGPVLPWVIFCAGVFLFVKYGSFIIFKPHKVISVFGRKNKESGISPLKTAILALASTLGVGNIVGVSTAIFSGGPGAVFWMTVSAFAAMPLKYGEVVLAMKSRKVVGGEYRGGAMYYMRDMLNKKWLSVFFALLCIICAFTVGNIIQVNSVADSLERIFCIQPLTVGIIGATIVFLSVNRGTKGISDLTAKLVPLATLVYSVLSLYIFFTNLERLTDIASLVVREAFNLKAVLGGVGGYGVIRAMRYGVARGIFSNEAGCGTSPTAHAKSNLKSPVEQGFWGIFEVFADTVVMCNMTAFVILLSYNEFVIGEKLNGMDLVLAAFGRYAGDISELLIALSVLLFAYATVICQYFYGAECIYYFTKSKGVMNFYRITFCLFVLYGALADLGLIWGLTDFNISLMTVINTACIIILSGVIKKETLDYFAFEKNFPPQQ